MGSRFQSHQLSNGLYVSGLPEQQPKERPPTMCSTAMPYTGGDIKKSGELGKMIEGHCENSKSRKSGPQSSAPSRNLSFGGGGGGGGAPHSVAVNTPNAAGRSGYSSGPVPSAPGSGSNRHKSNSGPQRHGESVKKTSGPQSGGVSRQNSGNLAPILPVTGLITSGPISSGPQNSSGAYRKASGPLDSIGSAKFHSFSFANNQAVTTLSQEDNNFFLRRSVPKVMLWCLIMLFVMGFIAGGFILGAVHSPILLIVVMAIFGLVAALLAWNSCCGRGALIRFVSEYPDAELRNAKNGEFVKITGVVTCGNIPLESSFDGIPRCVYTSTSLLEYRGWDSKPLNPKHRHFTWKLVAAETHAVDFYISDFQSGLRALVKAGYGAKVTPYVDDSVVVNIDPNNKDRSPEFSRWLEHRNITSDGRSLRLKEGYIKEGSTMSVMGVLQRNENMLMITAPSEPLSTGCQWARCILPASLEGVVVRCDEASKADAIPV